MATYKINYFSAPGMAEPIRFIILYSGKEFQENLFLKEDWPKIKPTTPFGKVPTLEIDGKTVHQSRAICRYLAKQCNLAGANDWENLQIDSAVDTFDDLKQECVGFMSEQNEAAKATKLEKFQKETLPFYMSRLEAQAKANGGYLANGKLSWADFYFATRVKSIIGKVLPEAEFAKYPTLHALCNKIYSFPKIADYISKRAPCAY